MDMILTGLRLLAGAVFVVAVIWAAISDIRTFEVPNRIPVIVIAAAVLMAFAIGAEWDLVVNHLLVAGGVLVAGFILFALHAMGAGDAKLLTAIALWVGWPAIVPYLFFVALIGGVLSLTLILFRRRPLSANMGGVGWIRQLHERKKDVPYAVALSLAALFFVAPAVFP